MSNNLQTNTTSAPHNAIMKARGKDRPPMLAPEIFILATPGTADAPPIRESRVKETYVTVLEDIRKKIDMLSCRIDAEAEAVHIILTRIDNDIYSIVDTCPNAKEMWKAIEHLKQGENIQKHDVETNLHWEFRKFTSKDGESLELYYSRFYKMLNELVKNQCIIDNHQVNVQFLLQLKPKWQRSLATTRSKGKEITKAHFILESDHKVISDEEDTPREKDIKKLMALISPHFKKIYKPTNNNLKTSLNTMNKNVDNTPRSDKQTGYDRQTRPYENQRAITIVGNRENVGTLVVQDLDEESDDQELEAHYVYMAKIQEVTQSADADNGPILDKEPLEKVHPNDDYNMFASQRQHTKQPESINDTYVLEKDDSNITPNLLDMFNDDGKVRWDTTQEEEHALVALLIET
ncbi:hypothetical protein Tco_1156261 [Tanacetum coccineum]